MTMMPERLSIDELKDLLNKFALVKKVEIEVADVDMDIIDEINLTIKNVEGKKAYSAIIYETLLEEDIIDEDDFTVEEFTEWMLKDGMN